ncbi:DUF2829 domain-containing protein [Campylobacter concisus]|nr:DUF2829 domain-containing protein [Campylobacter concisus]
MQKYIGVKEIKAMPMNRGEYNKLRGWEVPMDENSNDEGYLIEYADSKKNHPNFDGYISWSPKNLFEAAYQNISDGFDFGSVVHFLKQGKKVSRKGWNDKGMFLFLVKGSKFIANREPLLSIFGNGVEIDYCPHIDMKTADDKIVPWLASQTDVLATDWVLVE